MKFYWDTKEQSTKQHPVNIRFRVRIEIKHLYPCFITEINYGYSFWYKRTRDLIHTHQTRTHIYYCDKTQIQMFYFLNQKHRIHQFGNTNNETSRNDRITEEQISPHCLQFL